MPLDTSECRGVGLPTSQSVSILGFGFAGLNCGRLGFVVAEC